MRARARGLLNGLRTRDLDSQAGGMLLELAISIPVFTVGALGFIYAFQSSFQATSDILNEDLETVLVANAREQLVDSSFPALYATYNGVSLSLGDPVGPTSGTVDLPTLEDSAGNDAEVLVEFFVDETNLPAEFGPVGDLDGDGVLATSDCSTTYLLLPTRLTLAYESARGPVTKQVFLLLGND